MSFLEIIAMDILDISKISMVISVIKKYNFVIFGYILVISIKFTKYPKNSQFKRPLLGILACAHFPGGKNGGKFHQKFKSHERKPI